MRIVHVTPYFMPEVHAGIEVHVYELSKYLRKRGHDVAVYTCSRVPGTVNGIEAHSFPSIEPLLGLPNPLPSPSFFRGLGKEHDVLHLHGQEFLTSFVGALAAKRGGLPSVLTLHNIAKAYEEKAYIRVLRKIAYRSLFAFTIISSETVISPIRETVITVGGLRLKNVISIPHGIALKRFKRIRKKSEYVLYLGRIFPIKGVEYFVRAIPLVLKEVDTKFVVAGYGPERRYIKLLVDKLKISDYVKFLGQVSYNQVPEILGKASIFVAPGDAGYSILEAAASGKPIVSADRDWNVSCLGKDSAMFVKPGNSKLLADAIVKVLKDPKLAYKLSRRARQFVEQYRSWNVIVDRYIEVYEQIPKA